MLRWIVRALLVVTVVVFVMLAVGQRHQGPAPSVRLVVDQAAQPASSPARPAASSPARSVLARGDKTSKVKASRVKASRVKASRAKAPTSKADPDEAACASVEVPHEIIVNIRRQQLWACHGSQLVLTTKVTTGAVYKHEATPDGTWQVYAKQTHRWLSGPGYDVEVNYWMPFYGGYGIHDAPWQKMPYGTDDYLARGSHGCVQVPGAAMARLYAWAPVGATVHVED